MAIITPDNQEFKQMLKDLSTQSRLQSAESALLVKYQRENAGEDNDKREKQLEMMNETLKKILEALGPKQKRGKKGGSVQSDDGGGEKVSLRDELSFLLGGAKKIGSNIKESVKSTYFTKPTMGAPQSSAEALEASDALNQPKQVEVDQLRVAEETSDTQKEILKELKRLNDTTEENAQAGGGGGGGLSIDMGAPDGKGKDGKGKKPSMLGRAMGALGKAARFLGPVGAAAGAAYGAVEGVGRAGEVFGVDQEKASLGQKAAAGLGGVIDPFGLGYGDKAAKGVYGFFGGGKKEEAAAVAPTPTPAPTSTPAPTPTPAPVSPPPPPPPPPPPETKVGGAIAATAGASAGGGNSRAAQAEASPLGALQFLKSLGVLPKGDSYELMPDFTPISKEEVAKKISAAGKNPDKVLQLASEMGKPGGTMQITGKGLGDATEGAIGQTDLAPAKSKSTVTEAVNKEQSIAKERRVLRDKIADGTITPDEKARYDELGKQQIAAGEDVTKARAGAAGKLSIKQTGLKAFTVTDEQGEPIAMGKTPDEAIAAAKTAGASDSALSSLSSENAAMRDEMSASKGTTTPIVSNNTTSTSTNNFMPVKGDPRPNSRGSALDNHMNRVTAY